VQHSSVGYSLAKKGAKLSFSELAGCLPVCTAVPGTVIGSALHGSSSNWSDKGLGKNQKILAALSKCRNTGMPEIMLVRHRHFFSGSHLC
jgi:hypothetical protein